MIFLSLQPHSLFLCRFLVILFCQPFVFSVEFRTGCKLSKTVSFCLDSPQKIFGSFRYFLEQVVPEHSGPQTGAKVHFPITLSTQPRFFIFYFFKRSSFSSTLWISLSGQQEPRLEANWKSLEGFENGCVPHSNWWSLRGSAKLVASY